MLKCCLTSNINGKPNAQDMIVMKPFQKKTCRVLKDQISPVPSGCLDVFPEAHAL